DPLITEKAARACLLLPGTDDELRRATALADRAIAAKSALEDWIYPYFNFTKALAEYRQGRFESALAILEGNAGTVLNPAPEILTAMTQQRLGDSTAAQKTFAHAIGSFDWSISQADSRDVWMRHVLRREAEAMIRSDPNPKR